MQVKIAKSALCVTLILLLITIIGVSVYLSGAQSYNDTDVLLKQGASGSEVKALQNKLIEKGYLKDKADGIYGSKTKDAVTKFQRDNGLTADGIVGNATAKKLGISIGSGNSSGNSSYNGSDVYLLAKCINAEARGEPYIGQVAVGAVILNRIKDPDFPNTMSGVIYEPWAFTAVNDGQINLEPNDSAKRAAKDAMSGWDPTNGCVYYYNPDKTTNKWIWSRQVMTVIGKHRFAV